MTPWGQQRWAPLGAPPTCAIRGVDWGPLPVPTAPSSSRQRGGLVPKRGGARVAAVGATWEDPGACLLWPLPLSAAGRGEGEGWGRGGEGECWGWGRGCPRGGAAMGALGLGWGARSPCLKPSVQSQGKLRLAVRLSSVDV